LVLSIKEASQNAGVKPASLLIYLWVRH